MAKSNKTAGTAAPASGEGSVPRSITADLGPPLTADDGRPPRSMPASSVPIAAAQVVDVLPPMVELIGFDDGPADDLPPGDLPGNKLPTIHSPTTDLPNTDLLGDKLPAALLPAGQRPPHRNFLARTEPEAGTTTVTPQPKSPPSDIATLAEPAAEPPPRKSLRDRVAPMLAFRLPLKAPTVRLPAAWHMPRPAMLAAGAVAAVIVIASAAILGGRGPAAPSRVPASNASAPSSPGDRLAFYQKGADSENSEAQLQLAILYAKGEGVTQDYTAAAKWFRAAADQGSARAQYDLGVLYERGRGVPVDLTEAAKWYLKAAEAKYPLAQFNLAVCYTKGQGIRKDLPEAALWYRRAALQGTVQAMVNLGTMYERGDGVPISAVDAYAWYLAAGRRGNQVGVKRADEIFAALPKLDQIRAEALAGDVAASIHDASLEGAASAISPQSGTTPASAH